MNQNMSPGLLASVNQQNPFITQPPPGAKVYRDMFTFLVPTFASVAVGASSTQNVAIQNDADFEWIGGMYHFDLAAAAFTESASPVPNMSVLITDTGSGRQLMNAAVPVTHLFGNRSTPIFYSISRVFARNSVIQFTATNFDAAVANGNLRLSLLGWKIFYY